MIIMTDNQRRVFFAIKRAEVPRTVREIAEITGLSPSSVRTALSSLKRYGAVEIRGVATEGGTTWDVKP